MNSCFPFIYRAHQHSVASRRGPSRLIWLWACAKYRKNQWWHRQMLGCFLRLQFEPYIHNGCLPFTLANRSVHGLGKWFVPELRLPLFCTNQFQLPKNGREGLKLVSKMAVKKWNTNFRSSVRKNRTTFSDVPLLPDIFRWDNPKSRVPFTFQTDFSETFCKW